MVNALQGGKRRALKEEGDGQSIDPQSIDDHFVQPNLSLRPVLIGLFTLSKSVEPNVAS